MEKTSSQMLSEAPKTENNDGSIPASPRTYLLEGSTLASPRTYLLEVSVAGLMFSIINFIALFAIYKLQVCFNIKSININIINFCSSRNNKSVLVLLYFNLQGIAEKPNSDGDLMENLYLEIY